VLTAVDSLERNVTSSVNSLGSNIIYVERWPWEFTEDYPWWEYIQRPQPDYQEMEFLQENLDLAQGVCLLTYAAGKNEVSFGNTSLDGVTIVGVSHDYYQIKDLEFAEGRYFSPEESSRGSNLVILGNTIAEILFPGIPNKVGREVKVSGRDYVVVGVLQREGKDLFNFSLDENVLIPFSYFRTVFGEGNQNAASLIAINPKEGVTALEAEYEIRGLMRSVRKLSPKESDDFAINRISLLEDQISSLFQVLNSAGFLIGIFAILVGGFGIANIMFVAVKERTKQIGIKKSMGAKNGYILLEFLTESIVLCTTGGMIGLLLVFGIFKGLDEWIRRSADMDFVFTLSLENILIGLAISIITGVVFGILPAYNASQMKPVDAMRSL
jgi:putative ABC transport system permease protein